MNTEVNETNSKTVYENPLGVEAVGSLLRRFAVPSVVAMLVTALYNMVDQIFIGNFVGSLGNAATNIAFPLTMMCTAIALDFGIGGAAAFNLSMGAKKEDEAGNFVGNAVVGMVSLGIMLTIITLLFLRPMLMFFGAPTDVLPYACEYTGVIARGFPLVIFSVGGGHLIRADGKPAVAMTCNLAGAITNTILDALFVVVFGWGMAGAAAATVIGQALAASLVAYHLIHYRTVKLSRMNFLPKAATLVRVSSLGMSQGFNQLAMMVVQIVLNNSLKHYGALSVYGENIPIAVVGIATKVNMLYFSFCIGLSQGLQPIASFNYGAKQYKRTKKAYITARNAGTIISVTAFLLFQLFPRQIVSVFGNGTAEYYDFACKYFRIFCLMTFVNNIQPLTSNFFSSIGKPKMGLFLSLTRQIIFLLPFIVILPLFFGIEGILYAGPLADFMAFFISMILVHREFAYPEYAN